MKFLIMQSSPVYHHLCPIRSKCSPQHPVLKRSQCMFLCWCDRPTYTRITVVLHVSVFIFSLFFLVWPGRAMSTCYELGLSVFEQRNERQTADVRHFSVKSTVPVLPSVSCFTSFIYFFLKSLKLHVRWVSCHHGMAHPQVADGGTASRYGC
jgi:hypothetical protein